MEIITIFKKTKGIFVRLSVIKTWAHDLVLAIEINPLKMRLRGYEFMLSLHMINRKFNELKICKVKGKEKRETNLNTVEAEF